MPDQSCQAASLQVAAMAPSRVFIYPQYPLSKEINTHEDTFLNDPDSDQESDIDLLDDRMIQSVPRAILFSTPRKPWSH